MLQKYKTSISFNVIYCKNIKIQYHLMTYCKNTKLQYHLMTCILQKYKTSISFNEWHILQKYKPSIISFNEIHRKNTFNIINDIYCKYNKFQYHLMTCIAFAKI